MKYNKFQNDIINAWFKAVEKNNEWNFNYAYRYEKDDERRQILISVESRAVYAVPYCLFKLDTDAIFNSAPMNMKKIIEPGVSNTHKLNFTYELPWEHRGKKATLAVLTNKDGEKIYVNKTLLKYFDDDIMFKGTTPISPVYVYEGDRFVGLVLPVYHK